MPDEIVVEGVDYETDPQTGLVVFTRFYLEKRGYCCKNGCKNCPYGFVPDGQSDAGRTK